jgi:hypothetical protein
VVCRVQSDVEHKVARLNEDHQIVVAESLPAKLLATLATAGTVVTVGEGSSSDVSRLIAALGSASALLVSGNLYVTDELLAAGSKPQSHIDDLGWL